MTNPRILGVVILGLALSTSAVEGQDRSRYRDFKLGADLPSVSALAKLTASDAKTIHQRPAVMQDLQWRPGYFADGSTARVSDPVQQILFSFYNNQLFRMVVDYDRQRTNGMTDADMTDAISQSYGTPVKPPTRRAPGGTSQMDTESGTVLARWVDTDYAVALYRSSYASGFRLVVTSPRLDTLARAADLESLQLDAREAPQREAARQKKEEDDRKATQEKARVENKAAFRP
jgi:hypothetical protein